MYPALYLPYKAKVNPIITRTIPINIKNMKKGSKRCLYTPYIIIPTPINKVINPITNSLESSANTLKYYILINLNIYLGGHLTDVLISTLNQI